MSFFLLNLIMALIWPLLIGELSISSLILGFLFGFMILYWVRAILPETKYFSRLPKFFSFIIFFFKELIMANLRVAWDVITPQKFRQPGIVAVDLDLTTDFEVTLLANLITLTPGSMTVDISEDKKTIYIHSMFVDDVKTFRKEIKNGFEKRVKDLLR